MKRQLPVIAYLGLLVMPLSATATAQTRPRAAAATSALAAGQRIFDAQCAWCHGAGGEGGTGPDLHGRLRHAEFRDRLQPSLHIPIHRPGRSR